MPDKFSEGLGLTSIRSRLQQLYPNSHQFELHNRAEGGLSAQIAFPFVIYEEVQHSN